MSVYDNKDTFDLILSTPTLLDQFQLYLSKSLAEENLIFLKAIRDAKSSYDDNSDPKVIQYDVNRLIEEFIQPTSPMELNLASSTRTAIINSYQNIETFSSSSFDIFDEAERHIMKLLTDKAGTFYRELMSKTFEEVAIPVKNNQKRVVIIGGGFCGTLVATLMQKIPRFHVVLIDSKAYFEYTPAIITAIPNPERAPSMRLPHSEIVTNGHFIMANVDNVTPTHVAIGKTEIPFDYLAVATGSAYSSHIKSANVSNTYRSKKLKFEHQRLIKAQTVLVVGGGSVGVEIAGEIATNFPSKKVTLVEANGQLIKRMTEKVHIKCMAYLKKIGVEIILNERLVKYDEAKNLFESRSGRIFQYDMVYLAIGPQAQSPFLKEHFSDCVDAKKRIKVLPTLQFPGHSNILAGGDVTSVREEKNAYAACISAVTIARNICRLEKGKAPLEQGTKGSKPPLLDPLIQLVSLGTKDAMAIFFNSIVLVSPQWLKAKDIIQRRVFNTLRGKGHPAYLYGKGPSKLKARPTTEENKPNQVAAE